VPPSSSAKDLPAGGTQILNIRLIKQIDGHPAVSNDDISPESISDTENWHYWNRDLDNSYESQDD